MTRILWFAGALVLAACSQSVENQRASDERGGLRVSVHDLTEADVKEVHIDLLPDDGKPNAAPGPLQIILRPDDPGVRDDSGPYVVWAWSAEDLPGGAYLISAKAYDVANPHLGFGVLPTFESVEVPTEVKSSPTATVSLFLRQGVEQGDFEPPFVTAVRFDQKPEQASVGRISVWGDGGEGALSLQATGPGDLGLRGPPATWNGEGVGNARDPGGAYVDWIPNASGNLALSLILVDGDGNRSTLVLLVDVDDARGDIDFAIAFNHAPWSVLHSDSLVNPPTMSIELSARYGDVESDTALVDYAWDVSDCVAAGFSPTPAATGGVISGSIVGDESASHTVTLSLTSTPLPDPPPTCEVILEVNDRGLPGDATAVSTSTRSILVTLGQVHPCFGDLFECGGVCVDLEDDQSNCGACGKVCGAGQTCTAGACLCDDEDLTACDQLCVDLQNDADHCGDCDAACDSGLVCEIGICDYPAPVARGTYSYVKIPSTVAIGSITNPKSAAWHPSGTYALIGEYRGRVFKYVPATQELTIVYDAGTQIYWSAIAFSRNGDRALLLGNDTDAHGRIYVWDDALQSASLMASQNAPNGTKYQAAKPAPDGTIWILGSRTATPFTISLWPFDFATGRGAVTSHTSSRTCEDMAWATDVDGHPAVAVVCGAGGVNFHHYDGLGVWHNDPTSGAGNTSQVAGRPQNDYALAIGNSGNGAVHKFETGGWSMNIGGTKLGARGVAFSSTGKRALILSSLNAGEGRIYEYRHPLTAAAEYTNVPIPGFNQAPYSPSATNTRIEAAAWRPGCDEGLLVGGTSASPTAGYIIEFKVTNGKACP